MIRFVLLSMLAVVAQAAVAAVPLTTTVSATPGASTGTTLSVTALGNNSSATVNGGTGVALVPLSQFNPATGILLAARVTASVPVSVTTVVTGVVPGNGSGRRVTSTASYTGAITAPGVSIPGSVITAAQSCNGGNCPNSPGNQSLTTTGTIAGNAAVSSGSLASYYGGGNVNLATAGNLQVGVQNGSNVTSGTGQGTVRRTAGATYSVAYDYLNFSQASFSGASVLQTALIDFGTLALNSGPVVINFSLYNIGNANSAGFDLLAVTRDTNNSLFTTTLAPFLNPIAGASSRSFSMTFDPTSLGGQVDTFRLLVRDSAADVGNGIGAREYNLALSVAGLVALPEPGTWATMIIGFGLMGAVMRRRRALAVA